MNSSIKEWANHVSSYSSLKTKLEPLMISQLEYSSEPKPYKSKTKQSNSKYGTLQDNKILDPSPAPTIVVQ